MHLSRRALLSSITGVAVLAAALPGLSAAAADPWADVHAEVTNGRIDPAVRDALSARGFVEAIVTYDDRLVLPAIEADKAMRGVSADDQAALNDRGQRWAALKNAAQGHAGPGAEVVRDFSHVGGRLVRFTTPESLARLVRAPGVTAVRANEEHQLELNQSLPLINQPAAVAAGYTGANTAVAVLDTGLNYLHPSFGCTAVNTPAGTCRVPYVQDFAPDDGALDANGHGTNVAGIVAGVAPGAKVIGLDVFTGSSAWSADIIAAINWVITNRATYNIVAVNMSLGASGSYNTNQCGGSWAASPFANLRAAGVLPVVAAGNNGFYNGSFSNGISSPACAPGAISVGAVYDLAQSGTWGWGSAPYNCSDSGIVADKITCFSQSAPILSMLAPGALISAGGYSMGGTSQATPHVAGAVAVVSAAAPSSSVADRECAVANNGPNITDSRNGVTKHRLDLLAAAQAASTGCGGPSNPVPTVNNTSPATAQAGSGGFVLTVNGANFIAGSTVRWNGTDRPTTYISAVQLTATISAGDIASQGSRSVTVFNPAPGGGTSNTVTFTITAPDNPVPATTVLAPASAAAGSAGFTLGVTGSNFVPGSVVRWDGADRSTTFVDASHLTAQVLAADLATPGNATVTVFNPAPGGGTSNGLSFSITVPDNPVPVIATLTPVSATAGSGGISLTVEGTGFVPTSVVRWNGVDRATTFVSPAELTVAILAADLAAEGTWPLNVFNPAPGGGTSNPANFTVTPPPNPVPELASLSPGSAQAGGSGFTLTVAGSGFVQGATLSWNGVSRPATVLDANTLTAEVLAAEVNTAGVVPVTVTNPAPGGGASNALTFTLTPPDNPVPSVAALSPDSTAAEGPAFTLTVTGSNFVPDAVVTWNGEPRPTTFVSAGELTAAIGAGDIAATGAATVGVTNPLPGGGDSNTVEFTVTPPPNPTPAAVNLSPSWKRAGSNGFTLTMNGSAFIPGSTVHWNGAPRTTAYVSPTRLTAEISAADVATNGVATVTVVTPAPGGGTSNGLTFVIKKRATVRGSVHLNGQPALDGYLVQVRVGDTDCGEATVTGGEYTVEADCDPGEATVRAESGPNRSFSLVEEATYDLDIHVMNAFTTVQGATAQVWTGTSVAFEDLAATLPDGVTGLFHWDDGGQRFDFWFRGFPEAFQTIQGLNSGGHYFFQGAAGLEIAIPGGESFVLPAGGTFAAQTGVNGWLWNGAAVDVAELGAVLPPEVSSVFGWNNGTQSFDFWFRGFPDSFQTLDGLYAWNFYFLQASAPALLTVPQN